MPHWPILRSPIWIASAVVGFAGDIVADFPLTRGKARILSLLKFLEKLEAAGSRHRLGAGGQELCPSGPAPGLALVLSDLFDPNGFQHGLDLLRHHRYEPHVVQVYDRRDAEPELKGDLELFDVETETVRKVTITERNMRQYRRIFAEFLESVTKYCNAYGIGNTRSSTEVPFDELLLRMMRTAGALA